MTKTKKGFIVMVSVLALCIMASVLAQSAATILPKSATGAYMDDWGAEGKGRTLTLNATDGGQMQRGGGGGQGSGVSPPLPFMINGYVVYADKSVCNNPGVNITNMNTNKKWTAKTNEAANYYQLVLKGTTEVTAGDTLWFDVKDETQTNTTEHAVILNDIDMGGLYKFNITLESLAIHDINVSTDYPLPYSSTGIKIIKDGTEIEDSQNLTIGEGYMIRSRIENEGDFDENVSVTMNITNETGSVVEEWKIPETGHRVISKTEDSDFYRTWNTGELAPGYYTIFVNASIVGYADAHPENNNRTRMVGLETATAPELTSISVSPGTAALNVTETQPFTATAYDQYDEEMHDIVFTWTSTNETVGTINETTGLFTAIAPGTATVMAYNASVGMAVNGTAVVTVNVTARTPGDVNGDTEINIQDAVLLFNWVSFPSEQGTTYVLTKPENANVNGDTEVNIQDAVLLFNWVSFPSERGTTYILQ